MSNEIVILSLTAVSVGFLHTLFGPDHYLPFIMISKARKWSLVKTSVITFFCGIGHISGAVILGIAGLLLGSIAKKLVSIESLRGEIAAWLLISFGLVYFIWGIRHAVRNKSHAHEHMHENGSIHEHNHSHLSGHVHIHDSEKKNMTPWVLFIIFVLGPCEPLIPLVMYPALKGNVIGTLAVILVFGSITIFTMMSVVVISYLGMSLIPFQKIERYTHALAGASIFLCGMAIQFMHL